MVPVTLCRAHWLADTDKKWTLLHIPWTGLLHPLFTPPTPYPLLFLSYSYTHAFSLSLFLLCFFISPCCSPSPPPPPPPPTFPLPFASFPLFIPVLLIGKRKRERVNKFCCCGIDFFFSVFSVKPIFFVCLVSPKLLLLSHSRTRLLSQCQHLHQSVCSHCMCYCFVLFVGCLSSQQHASVSQGRICTDNFTCCHTEIEAADQTFHLTQSQYTDTGLTSPSADPITPGAWQGSHWSANF